MRVFLITNGTLLNLNIIERLQGLNIAKFGNVFPCNSFFFRVGNVFENSLKTILEYSDCLFCSDEHKMCVQCRKDYHDMIIEGII